MTKKNYFIPIIGVIVVIGIILFVTYPMSGMKVRDIPVQIAILDKGVVTPKGKVNVGDEFYKKLKDNSKGTFEFNKVSSKELDAKKYYATFVIPEDFTQKVMAGSVSKIKVTINEGKNPMVTSLLKQALNEVNKDNILAIKSVNEISKYGYKAMFLPMILILVTFISSVVSSVLIAQNIKNDNKYIKCAVQVGYIICLACAIGFLVSYLILKIVDFDISLINLGEYLSLLSLAIMILSVGFMNLIGKKGIILPMLIFVLGMSLIQLPYEFIPDVYQVLVASWEPLRFIGEGIRQILFQGYGFMNNSGVLVLGILIIIGILFMVVSLFRKNKNVNS